MILRLGVRAAICASLLATAVLAARGPTQNDRSCLPLTLEDIQAFMKDLPSESMLRKVTSCGVTSIPDADAVRRLRGAGASETLIAALAGPSNPKPGDKWTPLTDRRQMVWVPPGTFQMGSPATEKSRDKDEVQGTVPIERGFWLDDTEVTNDAFRQFVLSRPEWQKGRGDRSMHEANYLRTWTDRATFPDGQGNYPVTAVSWFAAKAFADWAGKRLPTEAEWEYAARAGTPTAYWWGDNFDPGHANNGDRLLPAGVMSTQKNPWDLYDMLGNVWEWTSSLYRADLYRHDDGREDPKAPGDRSLRGGAYRNPPDFLRSANRNSYPPTTTDDQFGFRCAR